MKTLTSLLGRFGGVLAVLAATSALAQTSPAELAREYMVRGTAAVEMAKSDRDWAAAEKEFRTATEIDPNLAAAWFNLGTTQARLNKHAEALVSLQKYLDLNPKPEDAQKVRDEIIKIKYRQERMEEEFRPGWSQIGKNADGSTVHIDKSTLKKESGNAAVQFLWDLATPATGGWGYLSMKGLIKVDCRGNRWTLLDFESFAEHMAKGKVMQSSKAMKWNPDEMWKPVQSNHWAGVIAKTVCE